MRVLIACESCRRQYDVSGMDVGQGFHCTCGNAVRVPVVAPHESSVTRCSSCGAARTGTETACRFCQSGYDLTGRALDTICAGCATRCAAGAKYCHSCGLVLTADRGTGGATELDCPVCEGAPHLYSRGLDGALTLLECHSCTGLWLSHEAFDAAQSRSRGRAKPWSPSAFRRLERSPTAAQAGPMYRKCPVCTSMMTRRNHGRTSGVIIDTCPDHGVWFDPAELSRILAWIEAGGEIQAKKFQAKEAENNAQVRSAVSVPLTPSSASTKVTIGVVIVDLLAGIFS